MHKLSFLVQRFSVNFFCLCFNSLCGKVEWCPEVLSDGTESRYNTWFTGSQHLTLVVLVSKQLKNQVYHHVLSWIQNNTSLSLSFCCVIALEYSLSFSNWSGEPSLHPVFIQRKQNFHWWCSDGQLCQLPVWKRMLWRN